MQLHSVRSISKSAIDPVATGHRSECVAPRNILTKKYIDSAAKRILDLFCLADVDLEKNGCIMVANMYSAMLLKLI